MSDLHARVHARILDLPAYLVDLPERPGDAYVVIYPAAGIARPGGYNGAPTRQRDELRVMCVSNSPGGVTRLLEAVRARLTGWNPAINDPSQGPLVESDTGPIISTRTEATTLHSLTIVYRAYRRRKQADHV